MFLFCLFLFFLIAPAAILYSQGYRIDFNPPAGGKKISQTGGLFLKVLPRQTEIYLDGKLAKKTDFFFGSVLIENLLPKRHKIEVKKAGFYPWEKTLEIKEKEVSEAKNIILFPENPDFTILAKGVENFWFSPDQEKIILKEGEENRFSSSPFAVAREQNEKGWALKLYELDKNVKSHLLEENDISPKGADLLNLEFSEGSKEASLEAGIGEQVKNFTIKLDQIPPVLTEKEIPPPLLKNALTHQEFDGSIYYLDNFGYVFKANSSLSTKSKINEIPFPVKPETEYNLKIFQDYLFLKEDKTLYRFNPDSNSFEKFFDGIRDLKISPDSKKIVYFSDSEIWVLFLKEIEGQWQKKAGEKLFLIRLSEKIDDVLWLDSNYLFFSAGNKIKISEIDERDRINIVDIKPPANNNSGGIEIFWNKVDKKLYILSEGNLYRSAALLP